MMSRRLADISEQIGHPHNATKPKPLYELYDKYFEDLADRSVTLLELGVCTGESVKTFASFFRNGTIIGVDICGRGADFSGYPNVVFALGDQRSAEQLDDICATHAPGGLDIVIDDASHHGAWSWQSYSILFPHLKPGGFYVVEDWATGYWDDWPDGSRFQQFPPDLGDAQLPKRLPSHDFGMVGLVKRFVDEVAWHGIRPSLTAPCTQPRKLDFMHVHPEFVVLRKVTA
jgi:SAM-dependent methyltransferase